MKIAFHRPAVNRFFFDQTFFVVKKKNMSKKYLLTNGNEYLGPDRVTVFQSYDAYTEKCDQFLTKAKKYKHEVAQRKGSVIHSNLQGYTSDERVEDEKLRERNRAEKAYRDCFDFIKSDDRSALFENSSIKTARVRIIRELTEGKEMRCESLVPVGQSWFLRFYQLTKFIQVVRTMILKRRLEKRLETLKKLVSEARKEPGVDEEGNSVEGHKKSLCECRHFGPVTTPCNR